MVSLYNCWKCNRRLEPEEVTEEYFFWCNKECYDQDDRYHNKEKIADANPEVTIINQKTEREQRKARIRAAIVKINELKGTKEKG